MYIFFIHTEEKWTELENRVQMYRMNSMCTFGYNYGNTESRGVRGISVHLCVFLRLCLCVCVCVCVRERERERERECVCEREKGERECVCERERERVCVCVRERDKEREREREGACMSAWESIKPKPALLQHFSQLL